MTDEELKALVIELEAASREDHGDEWPELAKAVNAIEHLMRERDEIVSCNKATKATYGVMFADAEAENKRLREIISRIRTASEPRLQKVLDSLGA